MSERQCMRLSAKPTRPGTRPGPIGARALGVPLNGQIKTNYTAYVAPASIGIKQ